MRGENKQFVLEQHSNAHKFHKIELLVMKLILPNEKSRIIHKIFGSTNLRRVDIL